jgi:hypothetical protein
MTALLGSELSLGVAAGSNLGMSRMMHLTSTSVQDPAVVAAIQQVSHLLWACMMGPSDEAAGGYVTTSAEALVYLDGIINTLKAEQAAAGGHPLALWLDNILFPPTCEGYVQMEQDAVAAALGSQEAAAAAAGAAARDLLERELQDVLALGEEEEQGVCCSAGSAACEDVCAPATPALMPGSIASATTLTATPSSCASTVVYAVAPA